MHRDGGRPRTDKGHAPIPKRLDAELEHSQWLPLSHQCVALVLDRHAWRQPGGRTRRLRGTSDSDCRSLPAMYCTRVQAGGRAKGRARTGWGEGVSGLVAPCSMLFRVHTYPVSGDKSVSSRTPLTLITVLCALSRTVVQGPVQSTRSTCRDIVLFGSSVQLYTSTLYTPTETERATTPY